MDTFAAIFGENRQTVPVFTIKSWRPRGLVEDPGLPQVMIQTYQRIGLQHAYEQSVKNSESMYLVIVDELSCLIRI